MIAADEARLVIRLELALDPQNGPLSYSAAQRPVYGLQTPSWIV
jgi:hypothetical protein